MSPLASINAFIKPNGMIGFMPPTGQVGGAAGPIPASELKQLTSASAAGPASAISETKPLASSFNSMFGQMVQDVSAKQAAANEAVNGLLSGQNVSLHQAMIAAEEASVSFQLMVEVRNKLLESYQELMRMQI